MLKDRLIYSLHHAEEHKDYVSHLAGTKTDPGLYCLSVVECHVSHSVDVLRPLDKNA